MDTLGVVGGAAVAASRHEARELAALSSIAERERFRDRYWRSRDPIYEDRLLWRAQSFRHLVHLLPGQSILELGAGEGMFTRQLLAVSRGENPITAVTFTEPHAQLDPLPAPVEMISAVTLRALAGRRFSFVIAIDLLDRSNSPWLLQQQYDLLEPGGQLVLYESNPWNPVLKLRRALGRLVGQHDPRRLLDRPSLYELLSEIGYIRTFAIFNDFVYAPLARWMIWPLRNLSILLENTPGIRLLAGSILIHAQKPPRVAVRPDVSLCEHPSLLGAISAVVPCHNEEMNVGPLVANLVRYYDDYLHEIVLVDDNSTDRTAEVIRELAGKDPRIRPVFRTPPNGVGRAIADGFRASTGRYVLSMDCDFQHLLPEIRDLFDAAAEGYDVVIGSRFSRHSILLNYPFQKIFANRAFHLIARVLLRIPTRDLTNNLKLMRREVVDRLDLTQTGFAVNAETGLQPVMMGYRVREVPISWINRTPDMGVSSFRLAKVGGGYFQVLMNMALGKFGARGVPPRGRP